MIISNYIQAATALFSNQKQTVSVKNVKKAEETKATEFVMSSEAKSFSQTLAQLRGGAADSTRADRVEALRQQIANGTYRVDSKMLAADMLAMRY